MSSGSVKTGPPVVPRLAREGTWGDFADPYIYIFDVPVRPCFLNLVLLPGAAWLYAKVNRETDGTLVSPFTSEFEGEFRLMEWGWVPVGAESPSWVDLSVGGQIAVHSVSLNVSNFFGEPVKVALGGWEI